MDKPIRSILVLSALTLLILATCSATSAESTEYSGEWQKDSGCWVIVLEDGTHAVPNPVFGTDLFPKQGDLISLQGELSQASNSCSNTEISVQSVTSQSSPVPVEKRGVDSAEGWTSMLPMIAILLLVFSVLGVVVTDESTQYATLRAAGAITRKSRSEEAIFLRGRITGFLASNEGLHFSAIADAFDMGNNQAAHHLSILEKEQYIWSKRDGRKLRFYTTAINSHSRDGLPRPADLPSAESVPARILSDIEAQEQGFLVGASQRQIAGRVGASQQLISHHLKSLERLGWVIRTGRGRRKSLRLTLAGAAALDRIRCDDEIPVTMTDVSLMDRITL